MGVENDNGNGHTSSPGIAYGQQPSENEVGFADVKPSPVELAESLPAALIRILTRGALTVTIDPWQYPRNEIGLDGYLRAHGVQFFSGLELCKPAYPQWVTELYASKLKSSVKGERLLLPGRQHWPRYAALALLLERLRAHTGESVRVKHVWRPHEYNARAKGSERSDHITPGAAADVNFRSGRSYMLAAQDIDGLYAADVLMLSIGLNARTRRIHVGMAAPRTITQGTQRRWRYDGG